MEKQAPKVFISYSHDNPKHNRWVTDLANQLLKNGVDVILDQWDLRPGDDVPKFMENAVKDADRVLMICTETYVHKANEGKGGVGYESMIVTGELIRDMGTPKFIPVIKEDTQKPLLPTLLSTRLYINLSDKNFEEQFENLLRELHQVPEIKKPPIGENPYPSTPTGDQSQNKGLDTVNNRENIVIKNKAIDQIYEEALNIAQVGDLVAWRRLIQESRKHVNNELIEWRNKYDNKLPNNWKEILPIATEGIETYAPLISIALAGVESGHAKFNNQLSILEEILYPKNWNRRSAALIEDFPITIAFIYQALHGAVCLETNQLNIAMRMVRTPIYLPGQNNSIPLVQHFRVMGWPEALEGLCTTAWDTISTVTDRWSWINNIFGDTEEYKTALCAYYMALNFHEYIYTLSSGNEESILNGSLQLNIPLCFNTLSDDIRRRAYRLLTNDVDQVLNIWSNSGADKNKVIDNWNNWMKLCYKWLQNVYGFTYHDTITHKKLINELFN